MTCRSLDLWNDRGLLLVSFVSPEERRRQSPIAAFNSRSKCAGVVVAWNSSSIILAIGHVCDNTSSISRFASSLSLIACKREGVDASIWCCKVTKETTAWQILITVSSTWIPMAQGYTGQTWKKGHIGVACGSIKSLGLIWQMMQHGMMISGRHWRILVPAAAAIGIQSCWMPFSMPYFNCWWG